MKTLLHDFVTLRYDPGLITESASKGNGTIRIQGILQRANAKNQNGRIYPKEILMREAERYNSEFIASRRAVGELDHPDSPTVNLRNVSHNIAEMRWEGDDLVGTIEILSTPSGNIVKELMRNGIQLGVSSRGMGSVVNIGENTVEVDEDFNLICFDIVSNPSTHGAYLFENTVMRDAKDDRINELIGNFFSELSK